MQVLQVTYLEVLHGAGVYNKSDSSTLYGFVVKVKEGNKIAVRKLNNPSLIFDLCFYTGACSTKEDEAMRDDEKKLTLYLDMAYVPALHTHEPPTTTPHTGHPHDTAETTSHSGTAQDLPRPVSLCTRRKILDATELHRKD